jgi:hypothetical protein
LLLRPRWPCHQKSTAAKHICRNCDFELKNRSEYCLQGFISGASYGGLETKKALMNVGVVGLQEPRISVTLYTSKTYLLSATQTPT